MKYDCEHSKISTLYSLLPNSGLEGGRMCSVDLYRRIRFACHHGNLSRREATRRFGVDRRRRFQRCWNTQSCRDIDVLMGAL